MTGGVVYYRGKLLFLVSPSPCAVTMLGIPKESSKGRKKWLWVYGCDEMPARSFAEWWLAV